MREEGTKLVEANVEIAQGVRCRGIGIDRESSESLTDIVNQRRDDLIARRVFYEQSFRLALFDGGGFHIRV